jgi:hypothetical protein
MVYIQGPKVHAKLWQPWKINTMPEVHQKCSDKCLEKRSVTLQYFKPVVGQFQQVSRKSLQTLGQHHKEEVEAPLLDAHLQKKAFQERTRRLAH